MNSDMTVPSDWREVPLERVLDSIDERFVNDGSFPLCSLTIERGVTPKTDRYNREFLVRDKASKTYKLADPGDLVFNPANLRWGAIAVSELSEPVLLSPIYEVLRVSQPNSIHVPFLKQLVRSEVAMRAYNKFAEGTLVERTAVKLPAFRQIRFALPPLPEQKKIAEILGSVDEAIQATQAVIDQTRKVKQGLLQQLLTRGIGHTRFKQTEIGQIPESWEVVALDDLVSAPICYGILMPGRGFPQGVPVVKVKDLKDGRIYRDDLLLTDPEIDEAYSRSRLAGGDILLSIRGTTGRIAIVPETLTGANITQDCARLRIRDSGIRDYVSCCLAAPILQGQIAHHTIGQAVKGINIAEVRKLRLPLPPPDERTQLTCGLQTVAEAIESASEALGRLLTSKRGLMQDLLTGRVRVAA